MEDGGKHTATPPDLHKRARVKIWGINGAYLYALVGSFPERTKNALYPRFLGDRGHYLSLRAFFQFLQLFPNPLMLIMGMRVERYPLGSILLLCGLQLVKNHPVCFEFLGLQLLPVSDGCYLLCDHAKTRRRTEVQ